MFKSILFSLCVASFFGLICASLLGQKIALVLTILFFGLLFAVYSFGDQIIIYFLKCKPLHLQRDYKLYELNQALARRQGIVAPLIYVTLRSDISSIVLGSWRKQKTIIINGNLIEKLTDLELKALLAYHSTIIKNFKLASYTFAIIILYFIQKFLNFNKVGNQQFPAGESKIFQILSLAIFVLLKNILSIYFVEQKLWKVVNEKYKDDYRMDWICFAGNMSRIYQKYPNKGSFLIGPMNPTYENIDLQVN